VTLALLAAALFGSGLPSAPAAAQPRETERRAAPARSGLPANVERVDSLAGITQYRLRSNGMSILHAPNRAAPVFTFLVVYHVGSRNEAPGYTGSAHLLEHLLFNKSTENFGRAKGHRTFQDVLYEAGAEAASTNMTTWYDRMTGFSTLPSDRLPLAMQIEADRMRRALLLDDERQPEMSVVVNEFEIGENNPYRALDKAVIAAAITAHPYHWSTIGYRSDLEGVPTSRLRQHYETFFWPNNSEAILVGDFDTAEALRLFDKEFGRFPRSKHPIPQVITKEPAQEGERRVVVRRTGAVGVVEVAYMRPGSLHPDFIPLDVLATLLGEGISSRLHQALVETGLATETSCWNYTLMDPYPIVARATVAPGIDPARVEAVLQETLRAVAERGVEPAEVDRAKRQLEVASVRERDGTSAFARSLGEAVASASWRWFAGYIDSVRAVTAADVQRVARAYLVPDHATVGWFVPEGSPGAAVKPKAGETTKTRSKKPGAGGASDEPSAASPGFGQRTLRRVLPNGVTLQIVANHAVPVVAVHGLVYAGQQEASSANPAIPRLTALMLSRGTAKRMKSVIASQLESAGSNRDYTADLADLSFTGSCVTAELPTLLSILAEELRAPAFSEDELSRAKAEMKSAVLLENDGTRARAWNALSRLVYAEGHPYRAAELNAMLAGIESARAADLRAFHAAHYVGKGTIVSIAGDVDPERAAALAEPLFGALPAGERTRRDLARTEPKAGRDVVETIPGKANMDFVFGAASGLRRSDPDWEAAIVANAALGQTALSSRIGKRVRDTEGLSYNLYSRFLWSDEIDGVWMVVVAVAPKNAAKAIRSTREEIARYCVEGITDAEMEIQKNYFAGNYQVRLATNAGVAYSLSYAAKYGYGPEYLDEFPRRVRAVTREQVNAAIRARIHPDRLNLVVAGDARTIPQ
jgi:zinc protease